MDNNSQLATIDNSRKVYCSIQAKTETEKMQLFNALQKCDYRLNDEVGKVIDIKNVYIQEYEKVDSNTGEPRKAHRTIIFDAEGKSHVTASNYLYVTLDQMLKVFGTPDTWVEPRKVRVTKKVVNNNREALSLELVVDENANGTETVIEGETA